MNHLRPLPPEYHEPTFPWAWWGVVMFLLFVSALSIQLSYGDRNSVGEFVSGTSSPTAPMSRVRFPPVTAPQPNDAERARAAILTAARCEGIESRAWQMEDVAWRESRLDPLAVGQLGEMGLFQFRAPLWDHAVKRMGRTGLSPWVPEDAALVAAWCFANGYQSHWTTHR